MPNSRALQFIVIFWVGMISLVSPTLSILCRIELANVFRAVIEKAADMRIEEYKNILK